MVFRNILLFQTNSYSYAFLKQEKVKQISSSRNITSIVTKQKKVLYFWGIGKRIFFLVTLLPSYWSSSVKINFGQQKYQTEEVKAPKHCNLGRKRRTSLCWNSFWPFLSSWKKKKHEQKWFVRTKVMVTTFLLWKGEKGVNKSERLLFVKLWCFHSQSSK